MRKYLYLLCLLCLFSASGCGADQKDTSDLIPNVLAMDDLSDAQASALLLGYSMGEGAAHTEMQTSPAWQGTYDEERTLVLDGEQGQNSITLSVQAPTSAIYRIYLPEGTVFDDGTRQPHDSQSSRLYWTEEGAGLGLRAPAEPGEYFYEIELQWEDPKITATYGLKLVMTGERSAYDEALDATWDHFPEADALSFLGMQTVEGEACYRFEVSLSEGSKQVAVSKTNGTLFELPAA